MNPKVECVISGVMSPEGSEEIIVSIRDERPFGNGDENDRFGLCFSHIRVSIETYRIMGLMVGDKVTPRCRGCLTNPSEAPGSATLNGAAPPAA